MMQNKIEKTNSYTFFKKFFRSKNFGSLFGRVGTGAGAASTLLLPGAEKIM
jgi:hypothetical protein